MYRKKRIGKETKKDRNACTWMHVNCKIWDYLLDSPQVKNRKVILLIQATIRTLNLNINERFTLNASIFQDGTKESR